MWHVTSEPHVMVRLKRMFPRVSSQYGTVKLKATDEVCRDLLWFAERFPLAFRPKRILVAKADRHKKQAADFHDLLSGKIESRPFEMALPPRDYQKVAAELALRAGGLLIADDLGTGKAQPLTSKVLTPAGWRRIGHLLVGDPVIDPDGGVGHVTGVFPQGELEVFKVTTKDGASAECSVDHLWGLQTPNDRKRDPSRLRVKPLKEFAYDLVGPPSKSGWSASKWFLPLLEPAEFTTSGEELRLDPYLVGVLIGDGSLSAAMGSGSPSITNGDSDVMRRIRSSLPPGAELRAADKNTWRLTRVGTSGPNPISAALREMDLAGKLSVQKHIPAEYLAASSSQRLELLRGLMDTDGYCSKIGLSMFYTSSSQLRDDVVGLVRSLGGIVSVATRPKPAYMYKGERRIGKPAWRLNVRLLICPFWLERKAKRWHQPNMARAIGSVGPTGRIVEMVCIRVSTKRSLYITDGHLVTHNTCCAIAALTDPSTRPALVVTMTHLTHQWRAELSKFAPSLKVHVIKKGTPYDVTTRGPGGTFNVNARFPDVLVINYHKLAGWADVLAKVIKGLVFDEVQELRRDGSKKQAGAIHLSQSVTFRLGLSATPIYNYGSEIYNVMNVLRPDALGERAEFLREWCSGAYREDKARITDPKAFGTYAREQGLMIRRTRADVGRELKSLTKIPYQIDADPKALNEVADAASELARLVLQDGVSGFDKLRASEELTWKLRQATGIAKAPYVAEFVRLLVESGERVLLYGWHRLVYDIWAERLKDLKPVFYTGSESPRQKEKAKQAFVSGESSVFIMSLRAGAGLDGLQWTCRTVVFGELDWSPKVHDQNIGRVHRDGQQDPVAAYFLVADCGSDPVVADVLGVKRAQSDGILDPNAALLESSGGDVRDRVRRLAEYHLGRSPSRAKTPRLLNEDCEFETTCVPSSLCESCFRFRDRARGVGV